MAKGKSDIIAIRDSELYETWKSVSPKAMAVWSFDSSCCITANSPCSRFWITEELCAKMLYKVRKGDLLLDMKPIRAEMVFELYHRYLKIKDKKSMMDCCVKIVNSPAPKFYIEGSSVARFIWEIRRKKRSINK